MATSEVSPMPRSLIVCVFLAGVALAQNQVRAQGDPEVGQDLAADWCSRCHDIGREGRMKQEPPSIGPPSRSAARSLRRTWACRRSRRSSVSIWTIWSPILSRLRKNEHRCRDDRRLLWTAGCARLHRSLTAALIWWSLPARAEEDIVVGASLPVEWAAGVMIPLTAALVIARLD
jgi:cytochrome c553